MDQKQVFAFALGLQGTPWNVASIEFDPQQKRLNIHLDFPPGSPFPHPQTGQPTVVYDTLQRSWRHLNFFQFECYVHAFVPRVDGGPGSGIKQVEVPWAKPRSGFTLMLESMMVLCSQSGMTVAEVAKLIGEYPQRVWNVVIRHVQEAHGAMELGGIHTVGIDEVSRRRGHNYLTILSQPKEADQKARVLLVLEGRDAQTVGKFREFLNQRGLSPDQIQTICSDMSPAYIKGISQEFPQATLVFDYFHVIQLVTKAVDEVRRRERKSFPELLNGTRWLFLKGEEKLTEEERAKRRELCGGKLQTGRAFSHLEALRDIMKQKDVAAAEADLRWWCGWVARSRIAEIKKVGKTIRQHWDGIIAYLKTRITNGVAEALNGIIQTVKRKSRGFRTVEYFTTMIYLVASHLKFDLPNPCPVTHTNSH